MKPNRNYLFIISLCILLVRSLASAVPTVSVMYFENLSKSQERSFHMRKALAEMLINTLASEKTVTIVEREQLEKALKEIALGQTGVIDENSTPRIGKMLGAQYLIAGNYMVVRKDITINLKLLEVETGVVISTGKVTGRTNKFEKVVSDLSNAALKALSAVAPGLVKQYYFSENMGISLETVSEYEKTLNSIDNGDLKNARSGLNSILISSPGFFHAKITLDNVEKRLKLLTVRHDKEMDKIKKQPLTYMSFIQAANDYMTRMKFMDLLLYCIRNRAHPPQVPDGMAVKGAELIDYYSITAANALQKWGFVVREGNKFLANYPTSMYFNGIKANVRNAAAEVEKQRKNEAAIETGISDLLQQLKNSSVARKHTINYQIGLKFFNNKLYKRAAKYFQQVNAEKVSADLKDVSADLILFNQFICYYNLFDKEKVSSVYNKMKKDYPDSQFLESMTSIMAYFAD